MNENVGQGAPTDMQGLDEKTMQPKDILKKIIPKLVTFSVVAIAAWCAYLLYARYEANPWTRDGQVRADIVQIAPRVNGYLVKIAVQDNQFVSKGDLLFQIDTSQFQLAVDQANASLLQARQNVVELEASVRAAEAVVKQSQAAVLSAKSQITAAQFGVESAEASVQEAESGVMSAQANLAQVQAQLAESAREAERAQKLADRKAGSVQTAEAKKASQQSYEAEIDRAKAGIDQSKATVAQAQAMLRQSKANLTSANSGLAETEAAVVTAMADLDQAKATLGDPGEANFRIQGAKVSLAQAELNLSWTSIYAPADGYISNMNLLNNTFVAAGTPFALFVDSSSFRVDAYFQETQLRQLKPGDQAIITLMGHHDQPLEAHVESIGFAINPPNLAETAGPNNIVPTIQPTFEWIRLAQRVPVRIRFEKIPEDFHLVSGMTASVAIRKQ